MEVNIEPVEVTQMRIVKEEDWNAMVERIRELETLKYFQEIKPKAKNPEIQVKIQESFSGSQEELIKELTQELISKSII